MWATSPTPSTTASRRCAVRAPVCIPAARKVSGWPKRCKFAHAFLWEYSDKSLQLAQLLSHFLTGGLSADNVMRHARSFEGGRASLCAECGLMMRTRHAAPHVGDGRRGNREGAVHIPCTIMMGIFHLSSLKDNHGGAHQQEGVLGAHEARGREHRRAGEGVGTRRQRQ